VPTNTAEIAFGRPTAERSQLVLVGTAILTVTVAALTVLAAYRPEQAFVALVALVLLVVCALRIEVSMLLLIALAPLEGAIPPIPQLPLTPTKLAGALCFASFILYALTSRRRARFDLSHTIVILLLAITLVSTLQAQVISVGLTTAVRYAAFVALYIVVSQFVGDQGFQRRLAWGYTIACAVAGLLALRNFIWEDERLARLPYSDPNDLAFILATSLPFAVWLLRERWAVRPLVLVMIGLISASVMLSFSRGALVGLGAAALWHVLTERRQALVVALGILVMLGATWIFVNQNPGQVESGLEQKRNIAAYNVETRLDAWSAAIQLAQDHPLLGVGPGNFQFAYPLVTDRPIGVYLIGVVHNAYLDVAAELGVVAMGLFLTYLVLVFSRATVARRRGNGIPGYPSAVRTALVIALVSGLFLSEQYYAPFWLLGGLATALWQEDRIPGAS
jgi:putative inorganic carbon (hco3(-)) transporter